MAWLVTVSLAGIGGWWAAGRATNPPRVNVPESATISVAVSEGSVSVEQAYGIKVSWPTSPVGVNGLTGTVTSVGVSALGQRVDAGAVLYTVDLSPVVAARGDVPDFRDLAPGMVGEDVRQLQQFLVDQGFLRTNPDGDFGQLTARAVSSWSQSIGVGPTDTVPRGRLTFLPTLPMQVAAAPELRVGAVVGPGQELLVGADGQPQFGFTVLPEAVSRTVEGMPVRIDANGAQWDAQVSRLSAATDAVGGTIAVLAPVAGAQSICGKTCGPTITLGTDTVLPGTLVLVPKTDGPQVPTAALRTDALGGTFVTLADGSTRPVKVLASADGRSIVSGVEVGERVLLDAAEGGPAIASAGPLSTTAP